jgi:hypothetical protein
MGNQTSFVNDTMFHRFRYLFSGHQGKVPGMTFWYPLHFVTINNQETFLKVREKTRE